MVSKYAQNFSQNLKTLLNENKISQSDLAKALGIPQQTISRYLLCRREPAIGYVCKIADYFGEDLDVLLGRREF